MKHTVLPSVLFVTFVCIAGLQAFGQETEERQLSRERLQEQRREELGHTHRAFQPSAVEQIQKILEEKMSRTPAQQKLDSHVHLAGKTARGALHVETMPSLANVSKALEFDERGNVHVDIQGKVSAALLAEIAALGGTVESSHPNYRAIRAWIPLLNAERLAERSDVTFIEPAAKAFHNSPLAAAAGAALGRLPIAQRTENVQKQLEATLRISASHEASRHRIKSSSVAHAIVDTSGVVSEGADLVQSLGVTGTGVKVGVMSDGVKSVATLQAAGDLAAVTVLSGQRGPTTGDEGTAMLEIVHDLAPGATLFFATAFTGAPQFATNIQNLAAAGCQIIVDDVTYFNEGAFQDGIIAQAVNTVTGNGVLYFSSAQNSGNLDSGTSGTWEGDFNGTGATIPIINTAEGKTVTVHAFDSTHNYDAISVASSSGGPVTLKWSDPLGAACDDYDLFVLDSTLSTVLDSSTNPQTCTQDPYEQTSISPAAGDRIVVVLFSGSTRALHVDTERAQFAISTSGATFGHNAAGSALTVAATPAQTTIFTSANQAPETYSSDGPRKIFFNPNGTAITPGNFLFGTGGGTTLAKVDFTAADCGQSAVPGFNPFCGTSAAAPTSAAIAALMLSANPSLTPSQVKSAMKSTALTAKAGFNTPTVGAGIVMANLAVNAVVPVAFLSPASLSFRTQPVATGSAQSVVSLINAGLGSLTINSITIAGANSGDFSVGQSCPNPLGPGANCLLGVTFKPTAAGPRKSSISVSDSAFGSPHTVILTGVGTAASLSPTTLPFAPQSVGTSSAAQTITLTNKGTVAMNLWQIAILGANAGDFSLSPPSTCGSTLGTGANCTVSVTFKPTAPGARTASVLFSDDGGGSPQAVTLTGTVASAQDGCGLTLTSASPTCQVIASGHLNPAWTVISRHGEYAQNETECNIPGMLSVANSLLTITTQASATTCGDFNTDGTTRTTPASWPFATGDVQWGSLSFTGGTVTVRAKFPPSTTSTWPAFWLLGANCQTTNIYSGDTGFSGCPNIGGSGYVEIDIVECYNSGGWCQFHVANPSFGMGGNCDVSYPVDTNFHTWVLNWTANNIKISMDGVPENGTGCATSITSPMFFIVQTQTGGVGGTPANLPTTFQIDSVNVQNLSGTTIFSDDFASGAPAVTLSPASLSFGNQFVNTSSPSSAITLTNTGGDPLTINSIGTLGANSGDFSASPSSCANPLPPGAACLLSVTFKPTAGGPRNSSVSISDSAPGSPQTAILTGVGTAASLSPTILPFAPQSVGTSSTAQTITLTNKGGVTMNLWQIAILGANAGDFSQTGSSCGSALGAGVPCTISIVFKPTATGARSATVLFSDDGGGSPQAVTLTGTGI